MSKILKINVCMSCPFLGTDVARNCWRCFLEDRAVHYPETEIPKWCQLPNATGESDE